MDSRSDVLERLLSLPENATRVETEGEAVRDEPVAENGSRQGEGKEG